MIKEILLLNPIYVTLFWAVTLSFHNRKKHQPKILLSWFMVVASIVYLSHFFYFTQRYNTYFYLDSFYSLAYLLVFPLYHIYVRLLTVDNSISFKKHFRFVAAPLIFFVLTLLAYLHIGKEDGTIFITNVLVRNEAPLGAQVYLIILFILGRGLFLLQTLFYLYLSFRLIRNNNQRLLDHYSNMDERKLSWVQFFNFCFALTAISSIALASIGRNVFLNTEWLLVFPSVVFTVMLFLIGLLGNNQKAVFPEIINSPEFEDEGKPTYYLKAKLDSLFQKDKIFKNPDLKIWDVSSMLGTNRTYVSKIINKDYGQNFCAHVNQYRVEYAKTLLNNNKNLTNEQIAELSGFGSVNSLYRAFMATENVSLGDFRKKVNQH